MDRLQRALNQAGSEEARAIGRELDGMYTVINVFCCFWILKLSRRCRTIRVSQSLLRANSWSSCFCELVVVATSLSHPP